MWRVAKACQYAPPRPTQPTDVNDYMMAQGMPLPPSITPPQPQPLQLQPTTSGDWCSNLFWDSTGTIQNVTLWHDVPLLTGGQVTFNATDHSYQAIYVFSTAGEGGTENAGACGLVDAGGDAGIINAGPCSPLPKTRNTTHFAPICLVANGNANATCDQLAPALTKFYAPINATPAPPATFQNIQCRTASDLGCDCTYFYVVQVVDSGNWSTSLKSDTISEESSSLTYNGQTAKLQTPAQTLEASYCKTSSGLLELTGANGAGLSNLPGFRTLLLQPM
jgi:hypothetical protein